MNAAGKILSSYRRPAFRVCGKDNAFARKPKTKKPFPDYSFRFSPDRFRCDGIRTPLIQKTTACHDKKDGKRYKGSGTPGQRKGRAPPKGQHSYSNRNRQPYAGRRQPPGTENPDTGKCQESDRNINRTVGRDQRILRHIFPDKFFPDKLRDPFPKFLMIEIHFIR